VIEGGEGVEEVIEKNPLLQNFHADLSLLILLQSPNRMTEKCAILKAKFCSHLKPS
jgi:hypothetical protein